MPERGGPGLGICSPPRSQNQEETKVRVWRIFAILFMWDGGLLALWGLCSDPSWSVDVKVLHSWAVQQAKGAHECHSVWKNLTDWWYNPSSSVGRISDCFSGCGIRLAILGRSLKIGYCLRRVLGASTLENRLEPALHYFVARDLRTRRM
jgi:hypothetical protein